MRSHPNPDLNPDPDPNPDLDPNPDPDPNPTPNPTPTPTPTPDPKQASVLGRPLNDQEKEEMAAKVKKLFAL